MLSGILPLEHQSANCECPILANSGTGRRQAALRFLLSRKQKSCEVVRLYGIILVMNLQIIYEDNHIIAAVKPAGFLSQGDSTGKPDMITEVKKYLKEKYGKPGNVFVGLVHRLDRPVTGIMLFAKTSKGAARLSEQFRTRAIQKTYHAIVVGVLKEKEGELKEKVKKISFFAQGIGNKSDKEILEEIKKATKTRTAELSYKVVPMPEASRMLGGKAAGIKSGKYSLLEIKPKTGRFHQIRVQMSEMGHPILGDEKYSKNMAGKWHDKNSIALCATGISFKTATGDKLVDLRIDLPKEWSRYLP